MENGLDYQAQKVSFLVEIRIESLIREGHNRFSAEQIIAMSTHCRSYVHVVAVIMLAVEHNCDLNAALQLYRERLINDYGYYPYEK